MTTKTGDEKNPAEGDNRPPEEQLEEALVELNELRGETASIRTRRTAVRERMKDGMGHQMHAIDTALKVDKLIAANGEDYESEWMASFEMCLEVRKKMRADPQMQLFD